MQTTPTIRGHEWARHPWNPVLRPDPGRSAESTCCMNPFAVRVGDEYRLYYAGGDEGGHKRICLATSPIDDPTRFARHGVVLDLGEAGAFDENWCVLPLLHRFGDRWHLYWTGRDSSGHAGLQSFRGIGLAFSDDGIRFERYSPEPVIVGDQVESFPDNKGIAGGGTILREPSAKGGVRYRMYYTLAVGTPSGDVRIDQAKHCAVCHSADGIHWDDHRLVMSPRPDISYEDVAVAAPFVWRDGELYRMLYSAIGTRWGYYSLGEAASGDGYEWHRAAGDGSLSLAPTPDIPDSWEAQMVEYACVVPENDGLRLLYCGNGYGATGIGMATAPA